MSKDSYNSYKPKIHKSETPLNFVSPKINNVEKAVDALHESGDFLGCHISDQIPGDRYTKGKNHFQGIQRLQNSNYILLSGGDDKLKCGNLFLVKMQSRCLDSAWRSNLYDMHNLPAQGTLDRIILNLNVNDEIHKINSKLWHVGGICMSGDLLAAPVESPDGGSVIIFYNFNIPELPTILPEKSRIVRNNAKTGGVAITDLPSGLLLVGALGNHDDGFEYLDLYISNQKNLSQAFTLIDSFKVGITFPSYQNINFVKNTKDELYLIGTGNTVTSIVINEEDYVDLYKLSFQANSLSDLSLTNGKIKQITRLNNSRKLNNIVFYHGLRRKFNRNQNNMSAAAGIYLHSNDRLFLYSSYHWRDQKNNNMIRFTEFSSDPQKTTFKEITSIHDSWLELYFDNNYKGIRLGLHGSNDTNVSDLSKTIAQSYVFGENLSSMHYQIPKDKKLILYKRKNYDKKDGFTEFVGSGKVMSIADLKKYKFGDKALSFRILSNDQQA